MDSRGYVNINLSPESIAKRAENYWNSKDEKKKIHAGKKYRHIFQKFNLQSKDWNSKFSELTQNQKNIIIKGELIRTYDRLPIQKKKIVKRLFGLSGFSTKWFTLSPSDKKILLASVLNEKK